MNSDSTSIRASRIGLTSKISRNAPISIVIAITFMLASIAAIISFPSNIATEHMTNTNATAEDFVKVGWTWDFYNWNPLRVEMVSDWVACFLIYSSLFQYDEDWDDIEMHLAKDYYQVVNPSGNMSTYINITEDAYFRNAQNPDDISYPLTAHDIKFTFDLIQANPGNSWDYYLYNVSGAYALTNHQIQIDTDFPKATLIDDLVWIPILPEFQWSQLTGSEILSSMDPDELIGSGPFYYEDGERHTWHKFKKAPNYHATADHGEERDIDFGGIQYQIYAESAGLATAINSGVVDVVDVTEAQTSVWDMIGDSDYPIEKQATQELGIYDIAINAIPLELRDAIGYAGSGNKILLDPIVREAIGMTLNRTELANLHFSGMATEADTVLNSGFWHADLPDPLQYNTTTARQLLIDAGYEDMDSDGYLEVTTAALAYAEGWADEGDELRFRLWAPDSDPFYETIGMAWIPWAAEAGIKFDFDVLTEGLMVNEAWYQCEYDMWIWSWHWGPEPLSNLASWLTWQVRQGGWNCVGPICQGGFNEPDGWWWADEENGIARCGFDNTFDQALRTANRDDRKVLVDELQVAIYETYTEFPPLYNIGLYATMTANFVGWGDWENHPGRSIISDMLWLWYDLEPSDDHTPIFNTPLDSAYETSRLDETSFSIEVSDPNGDPLTIEWHFGDNTTATDIIETGTHNPTIVTQFHTYSQLSEFELRVVLSDGTFAPSVESSAIVTVLLESDNAPTLRVPSPSPYDFGYVDMPATWTVEASDNESGGATGFGLSIWWNWGDGTYTQTLVHPTNNGTTIIDWQNHTWASSGIFNISVSVWDGFAEPSDPYHNITQTYTGFEMRDVNSDPSMISAPGEFDAIAFIPSMLSATAYDIDPDTLRFTWNFGDGNLSVTEHSTSDCVGEPIVSEVWHCWEKLGDYDVEVWVDDDNGHNVSLGPVECHVIEGEVVQILISPYNATLVFGEYLQFSATVFVSQGEIPANVSWSTDDSTSIDAEGLMFANQYPKQLAEEQNEGSYIVAVTASQSGFAANVEVSVCMNYSADHDGDGIMDWWEVANSLEPFDPSDSSEDCDGDGLSALSEFALGTDPWDADSDNDQLGDGFEALFTGTDPMEWDSDHDGIGDSIEFLQSEGYTGEAMSLPDGWIGMNIQWDDYCIHIETNSSVLAGSFDKETRLLSISLDGADGTSGAAIIVVPRDLCNLSDIVVELDNAPIEYSVTQNETHYVVYLEYQHSDHVLIAQFLQTEEQEDNDGDQPSPSPDEDDENPLTIWMLGGCAIAACVLIVAVLLVLRRRNNRESPPKAVEEGPPENNRE